MDGTFLKYSCQYVTEISKKILITIAFCRANCYIVSTQLVRVLIEAPLRF